MFYSEKFIYDGIYSDEYDIYIVSESNNMFNEYGINFEDEDEITLTFCYADKYGNALVWNDEILRFVHEWFIGEDYRQFIVEDDLEYCYLLKGVSIVKRFNREMKGFIDITFEVFENCSYVVDEISFNKNKKEFKVKNISNVCDEYKPVIELYNVSSSSVIIENKTNGNSLIINNIVKNSDVFIDNELGVIMDSKGNNLIANSNREWLSLKKDVNLIKISGDCNGKIKCMYPVMR